MWPVLLGRLLIMNNAPIKIGMSPPHPGEFIRDEILEDFGLSVGKAAEVLGVRRATLSDLVNGKASLSPEMALRLEKAFGLNMETMLRMQAWYDATVMRRCPPKIDVKPYHHEIFDTVSK
jgi:antitoxin HigA-1